MKHYLLFHRSLEIASLTLSLVILTCTHTTAESLIKHPPDVEKRSLITGVNSAVASKSEALKQGRNAALEKARNRLLELGRLGINYDIIQTSPSGSVEILNQKMIDGNNGLKPHLWIETETGYILRDRKTGGRPDASLLEKADLLDVRIWTDQKEYREGEAIILNLAGNRDFSAKIVMIDVKGKVLQILPNNYRQISIFEKERHYLLPAQGDRYKLIAQPPFGVIRFIVYATRLPMSHVNLKTVSGGIYEYRSSAKSFGRSIRQVIPVGMEQTVEFYEAVWKIKTLPR